MWGGAPRRARRRRHVSSPLQAGGRSSGRSGDLELQPLSGSSSYRGREPSAVGLMQPLPPDQHDRDKVDMFFNSSLAMGGSRI